MKWYWIALIVVVSFIVGYAIQRYNFIANISKNYVNRNRQLKDELDKINQESSSGRITAARAAELERIKADLVYEMQQNNLQYQRLAGKKILCSKNNYGDCLYNGLLVDCSYCTGYKNL